MPSRPVILLAFPQLGRTFQEHSWLVLWFVLLMLLSGFRQMRSVFEHPSWANRRWLRRISLPPEGPTLCRSVFSRVVPWVPHCQRAVVVLVQERGKKAHASWECKIISFGCRTTCVNSWGCEVNCRWEFGIVPSFQWRKALNRINIYLINWFFLSPYFFLPPWAATL